jgi:hypothetical protein
MADIKGNVNYMTFFLCYNFGVTGMCLSVKINTHKFLEISVVLKIEIKIQTGK